MLAVLAAAAALTLGSPGLPPSWTQTAAGTDGGTVWAGRIPNGFAPWDTRLSDVYLPPHYDPARRYPVLYLLHGLRGSPSEYWQSLHVADQVDGMIAGGAPAFIVVTPVGGQVVHPNRGEWAGIWEQFVVHDVVPWVDAHLSTVRAPAGRVLEGLSAGGYGAVDIGLRHPGLFGALGSWDGYFAPFRDGPLAHASAAGLAAHDPQRLVRAEASILRRNGTSFYLSAGGNHAQVLSRWTISFARELTQLRLPHRQWLMPARDRGHFWSATVPSALQFASDAFSA